MTLGRDVISCREPFMRWKTALHSVSYAGVWPGQTRLSLEAFLEKAKALGYDGVMLMAKRPHLSVLDYDEAARRRLRDKIQSVGLAVACLAGYTDFCLGSQRPEIPTREMQILYVTELARLARDLDCSLIRVFTGYAGPGVSLDQSWGWCVESLRECARRAAQFGVTIGVQNHHDTAVHHASLRDLLDDVAEPNCKTMFDAWAPALQGCDLVEAVGAMAPHVVHTTVADYVRRPRFTYVSPLVNYVRETDAIRAVPMGEGFIDYRAFFGALAKAGFDGYVAYEMCSPLRGGGSEANLDRCATQFLEFMAAV
ncbi:MAG: sugar phosphate isomerase/epimerase [Planctomycetaceae bacterium]|nr:sugar phosphate isomerase/epimerase [Planctomycetaceae bacterium]